MNESGLELRTKLSDAKTLMGHTDDRTVHEAGDMVMVGDTIGVVVEDVNPNSDFVLVYEAGKIVVSKDEKAIILLGESVYFDPEISGITDILHATRSMRKCGIALEEAIRGEPEIMIDLMVME